MKSVIEQLIEIRIHSKNGVVAPHKIALLLALAALKEIL
jgi:L-lysine 2,3-aminomutase